MKTRILDRDAIQSLLYIIYNYQTQWLKVKYVIEIGDLLNIANLSLRDVIILAQLAIQSNQW